MTDCRVMKVLWVLGLVIAPLVLLGIELFHPANIASYPNGSMYGYLSRPQPFDWTYRALAYPGPHWWFWLHAIQTPLVGLVAVGLWLLVAGLPQEAGAVRLCVWLSRIATFVFLIYYTALDSIGGTGLGQTILITERQAQEGALTPEQVRGVAQVLNAAWTDHCTGGVHSFVSETGSWAVFVAALFAALALYLSRQAPVPPLLLLVAFGWELQVGHVMPHGPLAFALLLGAALWIGQSQRARRAAISGGNSPPQESQVS